MQPASASPTLSAWTREQVKSVAADFLAAKKGYMKAVHIDAKTLQVTFNASYEREWADCLELAQRLYKQCSIQILFVSATSTSSRKPPSEKRPSKNLPLADFYGGPSTPPNSPLQTTETPNDNLDLKHGHDYGRSGRGRSRGPGCGSGGGQGKTHSGSTESVRPLEGVYSPNSRKRRRSTSNASGRKHNHNQPLSHLLEFGGKHKERERECESESDRDRDRDKSRSRKRTPSSSSSSASSSPSFAVPPLPLRSFSSSSSSSSSSTSSLPLVPPSRFLTQGKRGKRAPGNQIGETKPEEKLLMERLRQVIRELNMEDSYLVRIEKKQRLTAEKESQDTQEPSKDEKCPPTSNQGTREEDREEKQEEEEGGGAKEGEQEKKKKKRSDRDQETKSKERPRVDTKQREQGEGKRSKRTSGPGPDPAEDGKHTPGQPEQPSQGAGNRGMDAKEREERGEKEGKEGKEGKEEQEDRVRRKEKEKQKRREEKTETTEKRENRENAKDSDEGKESSSEMLPPRCRCGLSPRSRELLHSDTDADADLCAGELEACHSERARGRERGGGNGAGGGGGGGTRRNSAKGGNEKGRADNKWSSTLCSFRLMWPSSQERYPLVETLADSRTRVLTFLSRSDNAGRWWAFKEICSLFSVCQSPDNENSYFRYQLLPVVATLVDFVWGPFIKMQEKKKVRYSACSRKRKAWAYLPPPPAPGISHTESNNYGTTPSKRGRSTGPFFRPRPLFSISRNLDYQFENPTPSLIPCATPDIKISILSPQPQNEGNRETRREQVQEIQEIQEIKKEIKKEVVTNQKADHGIRTKSEKSQEKEKGGDGREKREEREEREEKDERDKKQEQEVLSPVLPPLIPPVLASRTFLGSGEMKAQEDQQQQQQPQAQPSENLNLSANVNSFPLLPPSSSQPLAFAMTRKQEGPASQGTANGKPGAVQCLMFLKDGKPMYYDEQDLANLLCWSRKWDEEKQKLRAQKKQAKKLKQKTGAVPKQKDPHRRFPPVLERFHISKKQPVLNKIWQECKNGTDQIPAGIERKVLTKPEDFQKFYGDVAFPGIFFRKGVEWDLGVFRSIEELLRA